MKICLTAAFSKSLFMIWGFFFTVFYTCVGCIISVSIDASHQSGKILSLCFLSHPLHNLTGQINGKNIQNRRLEIYTKRRAYPGEVQPVCVE